MKLSTSCLGLLLVLLSEPSSALAQLSPQTQRTLARLHPEEGRLVEARERRLRAGWNAVDTLEREGLALVAGWRDLGRTFHARLPLLWHTRPGEPGARAPQLNAPRAGRVRCWQTQTPLSWPPGDPTHAALYEAAQGGATIELQLEKRVERRDGAELRVRGGRVLGSGLDWLPVRWPQDWGMTTGVARLLDERGRELAWLPHGTRFRLLRYVWSGDQRALAVEVPAGRGSLHGYLSPLAVQIQGVTRGPTFHTAWPEFVRPVPPEQRRLSRHARFYRYGELGLTLVPGVEVRILGEVDETRVWVQVLGHPEGAGRASGTLPEDDGQGLIDRAALEEAEGEREELADAEPASARPAQPAGIGFTDVITRSLNPGGSLEGIASREDFHDAPRVPAEPWPKGDVAALERLTDLALDPASGEGERAQRAQRLLISVQARLGALVRRFMVESDEDALRELGPLTALRDRLQAALNAP